MGTVPPHSDLPRWVHDAATLPMAFAQVREDALVDLAVLRQAGPQARVMMIASGGCTAAALAASADLASLQMVDPNPAQIALTRLKLGLLQRANGQERAGIMGHAPMRAGDREAVLAAELRSLDLPGDALGPMDFVAAAGPDHAGRYERVFVRLRERLATHTPALDDLLRLSDPDEQSRRVAPSTELGRALDESFDDALTLPNLVQLFGAEATNNPVEPFSRHFARRTRHVLGTLPANSNPFLWQMLAGRFPAGTVSTWLSAPAPSRLPVVTWTPGVMDEALAGAEPGSLDFVHLSNILDWLSPAGAGETLRRTHLALRAGGLVLIRQLNSTLHIPALAPEFEWKDTEAAALHALDRSFFYRRLHIGRKP